MGNKRKNLIINLCVVAVIVACVGSLFGLAYRYKHDPEYQKKIEHRIAKREAALQEYAEQHTYEVISVRQYVAQENRTNLYGGVMDTDIHLYYVIQYLDNSGKLCTYKDFEPDACYYEHLQIGESDQLVFNDEENRTLILTENTLKSFSGTSDIEAV